MSSKGIGLLLGLGKPSEDEESSEDGGSRGMACKAMLKALKSGDHEAFGESLDLFLDARKPKVDAEPDDE